MLRWVQPLHCNGCSSGRCTAGCSLFGIIMIPAVLSRNVTFGECYVDPQDQDSVIANDQQLVSWKS